MSKTWFVVAILRFHTKFEVDVLDYQLNLHEYILEF